MESHTFVIPAYKEPAYLDECIQSLLRQTVKSNIIITTSTPTRLTAQIAEKYNLDYYINTGSEKGIAADWNFALSKVASQWATLAHQDDIYDPVYTQSVLGLPGKDDALIVFTDYHDMVNGQLRPWSLNGLVKRTLLLPVALTGRLRRNFFKKMMLAFGDPICCPSVAFNLKNLEAFSFSPGLKCVLDWQAWYQLAKRKGAFAYISKKLVSHRIHTASETTVQISSGIRRQEELLMFKTIWGESWSDILSRIYAAGHAGNKS